MSSFQGGGVQIIHIQSGTTNWTKVSYDKILAPSLKFSYTNEPKEGFNALRG